jgi:hypothetical protein
MKGTRFNALADELRAVCAALPDRHTGKNLSYTMADLALSAFAVFFTQSPSFLGHQRAMQTARGHNNARSFFEIEAIPCDAQIRQVLDAVPPEALCPVYDRVYETLREHGILARFRGVQDSTWIALDGTWYFSSQKLHCPHCSHLEPKCPTKSEDLHEAKEKMAGAAGLEPVTSAVTGQRSNQLSYAPALAGPAI